MALLSQGPPGQAPNRDRRDAPPWRVLPLVLVVDLQLFSEIFSSYKEN